ncbi:MAG: hypothetical protein KAV42_08215 [Candidatus Krumholzibacteria bacterium]|nr:hypothetical protein [Candidatus Krumholzibacteria bacterium]
MKIRTRSTLIVAVLFFAVTTFWLLVGCSDSTEPKASTTGSAMITCNPAGIDPSWNLSGPGSYNYDATGDITLDRLAEGDYTITWGDVSGYVTPASETLSLTAGNTVEFTATYTEAIGTIVIENDPDELYVRWNLTGPDGFNMDLWEETTIPNRPIGDYTITWGEQSDWITPSPETQALAAGDTIVFEAIYVPGPNTILVTSEPDGVCDGWNMHGPNSFSAGSTGGFALLSHYVVPGEYSITWNSVDGWNTPAPETLTLAEDGTINFHGVYTAISR